MSFKLTDFITVTGTGNVGIGTTSPNRNLSIVSTTDTSVEIKSGTANQSSLWFSDTDDGNIGGVLYTHNDNGMEFRVNDSTRLTITSGGNVGIGGTPSYTLHVSGNIIAVEDSTPAFRLIGSTTSFDLKSDGGVFKVRDVSGGNELYHIAAGASGYHNWYINDSLKMILDSSGNVGIGASTLNSPSRLTLLESTGNGQTLEIIGANSGGVGSQPGIKFTGSSAQNIGGIYADTSSDNINLQTGGTTRLTISSGGAVRINNSLNIGSADESNYPLQVRTGTDQILRVIDNVDGNGLQIAAGTDPNFAAYTKFQLGNGWLKFSSGGDATFSGNINATNASSTVNIIATGINSGTNGGSTLIAGTTGVTNIAIGNKSAILGGAFDATSTVYWGNGGSLVFNNGANRLTITSTGAIAVGSSSTNYGSSGQVLTSNGNASPSWTSASGAKGEPGGTGAQGTAGSNGSNGAQGTAGTNGSNGALGSQGTNGSTGAQGAVGLNGGTGGQGTTGATGGGGGTGAQGTAGSNGSNGGTGAQGTTGTTGGGGGTGAQGTTGSNGGTGAQGTAGSNGSNGNNGAQGTTGTTGNTGSTGSNGSNGGTGAQGTSGVATFPYSGTAVFSNQIQLSNSDGYIYGGSITTRSGARAIHMGYTGTCIFQAERTDSSSSAFIFTASSNQTYLYSRVSGGSTTGRRFLFTMGNSTAYAVETNNYVTFYGGYGNSSDRLFKKNIEDSSYGLSEVNSLKPRRFYWKDETKSKVKQIGFIAQELEEILPEAVRGHEGNKSIMDSSLISVLTKAIQELSQQVTDLKAEVELLKQ